MRRAHRVITTGRRFQGKGSLAARREKRTFDNIVFDSMLEMEFYRNTLRPLLNGRQIEELEYHPLFEFTMKDPVTGEDFSAGSYEADFSYIETDTRKLRVLDVKAWERHPRTGVLRFITGSDYLWQKQLMRACFGIIVEEV